MEKVHSRINWENYPSIATPLNEANLNKMDKALDEVDNRVLGLDTAKLDKSTANTMVKDVTFDESTGIFTVTLLNGTAKTIDTKLEKVVTNFRYDNQSQKLVLTLADGSEQQVDLSSLISNYEFADGNIITFIIGSDGKVTANVKDGSITETKLQPNFLANVKTEVSKAKSYADSSYENATTSRNAVTEAKQYRDEALQFRNEAESFAPEGYADLVEQVNENTVKVDTIIEKADLGIKETATGEEIHITDSAEGKAVEFALYGKAKQNTTSGKNLIESVEKLNWSVNSSGTQLEKDDVNKKVIITTNGTSPYSGCWLSPKGEFIGKTCTVSADITISSGSEIRFGFNGVTNRNITPNQKIRLQHTAIVDTGGIVVYSGEAIVKTITVENLQIEYGEVATPFEEFTNGATPRPDYEQPIEVSGESGSVEVKSVGKNLIGTMAESGGTATVTKIETGLNLSNTSSATQRQMRYHFYGKPNTKYTISSDVEIISGTARMGLDGASNLSTGDIKSNGKYQVTTKSREDGYILITLFCTRATSEVGNVNYKNLQLEEGDAASEYEPYKETLSTIPTENGLAGIKVSSGGNYTDQNGQQWICDEVVKYADGSGKKVKRFKYLKVTSIQSGHKNNKGDTVIGYVAFDAKPTSNAIVGNVLCNRCVNVSANEQFEKSLNGIAISSGARVDLSIVGCATTNELRTYISENDVYVLYELANPIETPLTAEEIAEIEKLQTFYPITNISNDFDCGMSVKYNADSKNYIDNKIALLTTAMINNI